VENVKDTLTNKYSSLLEEHHEDQQNDNGIYISKDPIQIFLMISSVILYYNFEDKGLEKGVSEMVPNSGVLCMTILLVWVQDNAFGYHF
jgi:hypothetical protein